MPNPPRIMALRDYQPASLTKFTAAILRSRRVATPMPQQTADGPVLNAEINHGRYLVRCPSCAGAELVDMDDPRFYCLSCYNEAHGGNWLPVKLPSASHRAKLEAELLKRPKRENQNWLPGETLRRLQDENAAQGVV